MLQETTKPNGSGSHWLEIGDFKVDDFGDKIWIPGKPRYPNEDPRLKVKREFDGKSGRASQRIHWKIIVPDDYDKKIVRRWADGNVTVLWPEGEAE